jgi:hypothetical protein
LGGDGAHDDRARKVDPLGFQALTGGGAFVGSEIDAEERIIVYIGDAFEGSEEAESTLNLVEPLDVEGYAVILEEDAVPLRAADAPGSGERKESKPKGAESGTRIDNEVIVAFTDDAAHLFKVSGK